MTVRLAPPQSRLSKQLAEQLLCPDLSFFRQAHGLRFADGIADVTFLVQAIHGIPIVAFPRGSTNLILEACQVQQSQNRFVNLVRIDSHLRFTR